MPALPKRSQFITLEGGEGSGKSTQLQLLSEAFHTRNIPHITTREPGGAPLSERIRGLLVENAEDDWSPDAELLLFMAARVEHVRKTIQPALERGEWVLCDRFHDSSRIYQGVAKDLGVGFYDRLHQLTLGNLAPDHTFLLDIDPVIGLARAGTRNDNETRFEDLGLAFHQRLREGFLILANAAPERITLIDATKNPAEIHTDILSHLDSIA